jgi:hypothetical protein
MNRLLVLVVMVVVRGLLDETSIVGSKEKEACIRCSTVLTLALGAITLVFCRWNAGYGGGEQSKYRNAGGWSALIAKSCC